MLFKEDADCLIESQSILLLISDKYDKYSIRQIRERGIREEIKKEGIILKNIDKREAKKRVKTII